MNRLLTNKATIKRNVMGFLNGSKQPVKRTEIIYEHLPCRIIEKKLYVKYKHSEAIVKIQKDDIVIDEVTGFKYFIADHPQLGGGIFHHWEATLEIFINE